MSATALSIQFIEMSIRSKSRTNNYADLEKNPLLNNKNLEAA